MSLASRPLPVDLVAIFAAQPLSVAAPVLSRVRLRVAEWAQVRNAATPECRRFISTMGGTAVDLGTGLSNCASAGALPPHALAPSARPTSPVQGDIDESAEAGPAEMADSSRLFSWPLDKVLETITQCREELGLAAHAFSSQPLEGGAESKSDSRLLPVQLLSALARALRLGLENIASLSEQITTSSSQQVDHRTTAQAISCEAHRMWRVVRELSEL